ncbi:MAG: KGG domain-containing protein, partial [Candidatus Saccharimonas sp.]
HTGGFAANPELARIAGAKGGRISRRTKVTSEK